MRPVVRDWLVRGIGVAALCASANVAQSQTTGTAATSATRADLGEAYLRMDKAYVTASLTDSARAAINQRFDRATLRFFAGRSAEAIAIIDSATTQLTGAALVSPPPPRSRVVNGRAASIARDAFLARLAKLDTTGPLAQAIISARARAGLMVDVPSRERLAEWLSDPAQLARDLAREVSVLERGRNPYVGQAGDAWHTFRGDQGTLIPMRVVAPSAAATSSAPIPVLIVLHGTGGDENMFIEAYGQGLAATMGLAANTIVVSPLTTTFGATPAHFDSLMAVLRSSYRVNGARVYVLGHSVGASVAARLAQARPTQITAVACLAGGAPVTVAKAPPVLFIGAALDPIIPASVVQRGATGTLTGTYRQLEHEGHTLMVANALRLAVPWLLDHRP
jgi:predicted esterase